MLKNYTSFLKLKNFTYILPGIRILNFKRPKWKKLQNILRKRFQKKFNYLKKIKKINILNRFKKFTIIKNFIKLKHNKNLKNNKKLKDIKYFKKVQNIKKFKKNIEIIKHKNERLKNLKFSLISYYPQHKYVYYTMLKRYTLKRSLKTSIDLKNTLYLFFDNNVSIKYYKKLFLKKFDLQENFFFEIFLRPLFILEVFLWKLNIFSSKEVINQNILCKKIKINNKIINGTTILHAGDIINIISTVILSKNFKLPTFLGLIAEVDYYTNSIIILRDYKTINKEILLHLIPEIINYYLFLDYIKHTK